MLLHGEPQGGGGAILVVPVPLPFGELEIRHRSRTSAKTNPLQRMLPQTRSSLDVGSSAPLDLGRYCGDVEADSSERGTAAKL